MKRLPLYLIPYTLFLLCGCSPQQRLTHLLRHHPELVKHDTVWHNDTIRISESRKDTVFKNEITRDTIIIHQDKLTIKYFNSKDSVFISGKCDSIVKLVKVPMTVNTITPAPETLWYDNALRWFFVFILLLGVFRLLQLKYSVTKPK